MLGLARVDGDTMTDWLWDVLSNRADPTGLTGAKPLMPTHRRMLELQVWGHSLIRSIPFDLASAHGLKCRAVIQEDYRRIRSLALDGNTRDPEIYRRVLDALGEKHRVSDPENYFIPADLPKETRLPHATTITDAFTDTNGTSLDAHTTGGGWNWVENASTWEIQGNAATCTVGGGGNIAFANTDLSSDDHYSQITATTVGSDTGVVTRVAAETDAYLGRFTTSNQIYVRDTNYSLIATNAGSVADGDIFKMESDGSTHTFYKNGSSVLSVGDTVNTGQLKCGIATLGNGVSRLDDFVAADLAAGAPPALPGNGGGGFDDRVRVQNSVFLGNGTDSSGGTFRSPWPDSARDLKWDDQRADNRTRMI
jgi:hypothetical protein